jgi:hypothetical protein
LRNIENNTEKGGQLCPPFLLDCCSHLCHCSDEATPALSLTRPKKRAKKERCFFVSERCFFVSELRFFVSELRYFVPERCFFVPERCFFVPELRFFVSELRYFVPELRFFVSELRYFVPELRCACKGLSTFNAFGVTCHPIIKLASAQSYNDAFLKHHNNSLL